MSDFDLIPTKDYKAICDLIRQKENSSELIKSGEITNKISTLETNFLEGNIQKAVSDLPKIRKGAFMDCPTLTEANFPNLLTIPSNCFSDCSALNKINFPKAKIVEEKSFYHDSALSEGTEFPEVTEIYGEAFYKNSSLRNFYAPKLEILHGESNFSYDGLRYFYAPKLKRTGQYSFYNIYGLPVMDFPELEEIGYHGINGLSDIYSLSFPHLKKISRKGLESNSHLSCLILSSPTMCILEDKTAFYHTPIGDGNGYIYVPNALLAQYKADVNWSLYSEQIRAIEDFPKETSDAVLDYAILKKELSQFVGKVQFSLDKPPASAVTPLNIRKTVVYEKNNDVVTIYNVNGGSVYAPVNSYRLFSNLEFSNLDLTNLDLSLVKSARMMFAYMHQLQELTLPPMPSLELGESMFERNYSKKLDLSKIGISKLKSIKAFLLNGRNEEIILPDFSQNIFEDMSYCFQGFRTKTTIDLSSLKLKENVKIHSIFKEADFQNLDISSFDTTNVADMSKMFEQTQIQNVLCRNQEEIDRYKATVPAPPATVNFTIKQI